MSLPIRHIARAIVLDPADRLLLIEYVSVHAKGPEGEPLHFWFMPGGGLEPGEDHVTACSRELGEEIGRADAEIGPQVAACDGPFHLFKQARDARERYFVVRLPDDRVDTSQLAETEDNPLVGTRWWTLDELRETTARIEPAGLVGVVAHLIEGMIPPSPTVLHWHEPATALQHALPRRGDPMFPTSLTDGYRSFLNGRFPEERRRFKELATSQAPEVLVISCCDSRVAPEAIFDAGPGELFVIRNVANIVPVYETGGDYHGTSAAIEFAVIGLKIKHIVVLGHATCGGIKAYATKAEPLSAGNFIGKWTSLVAPAEAKAGDSSAPDYLTRLEHAMVSQSMENLLTFPFVKEQVDAGKITIHGAHFGVANGILLIRNPETGDFAPATDDAGRPLRPSDTISCS